MSSEVPVNVNNLQLLSLAINFLQTFDEAFQGSKIPRIKITRNSKLPGYKSVAGVQISKDLKNNDPRNLNRKFQRIIPAAENYKFRQFQHERKKKGKK